MKYDKKHVIRDLSLAAALILLAALLSFCFKGEKGTQVEIYKDGKLLNSYSLSENITVTVDSITVKIESSTVCITESSCSGKDCIKSGKISRAGQCIVCLPNRLTVKITGKTNVDGVTG